MKYCMECGEKMEDDQAYCPNCGTKALNTIKSQYNDVMTDNVMTEEVPAPAPKKKSKLGLIIGIGAAVLAVGAVFLILALTGVFKTKEKILAPSKDKLVTLEDRFFTDLWNKSDERVNSIKSTPFDADVTFQAGDGRIEEGSSYGGLDTATLLNNASLQISVDGRKGFDVGAKLNVWSNPVLDLRLFDLSQRKVSFYCSPGSNKLYEASVDVLTQNLLRENGAYSNVPVEQIFAIVYSGNTTQMLQSDYNAVKNAFVQALRESDVQISTDQPIGLFNGEEQVVCEVYVVHPTQQAIETFLNSVIDVAQNGNGLVANIARISGATDRDFNSSREDIPEIAEEIMESNLTFEIAIIGNDVVRQKATADEFQILYETHETENGKRMRMTVRDDREQLAFMDYSESPNGQATAYMKISNEVTISGSFNTKQKSVIGTCAGRWELANRYSRLATVVIEPSSDGYMHRIILNSDELDLDLEEDLKININVKKGNGVERPKGAEVEDISYYSSDELYNLMMQLVYPIQLALMMGGR